jgi:hypothetical protein
MRGVFRNEGKYNKYQRTFRKVHYIFMACAIVILADVYLLPNQNLEQCITVNVFSVEGGPNEKIKKVTTNIGVFYSSGQFKVGDEALVTRTPFFRVATLAMGSRALSTGSRTVGFSSRGTHSAYDVWWLYQVILVLSIISLVSNKDQMITIGMGFNTLMFAVCLMFAIIY